MKKTIITGLAELGRERFEYVPETGDLFWKDIGPEHFPTMRGYRIFRTRFAGTRAGYINADGYVRVRVGGRLVCAHRLIWAIVHGYDPKEQVDHRDGNPENNRLDNLREATNRQNSMNRDIRANNTSGHKGVSWHRTNQKWQAYIGANGMVYLGYYATKEEAAAAYQAAALELHGDFRRH